MNNFLIIGVVFGSLLCVLCGALLLLTVVSSLNQTLKKISDKIDARQPDAGPHYVKSIFSGGPADGLVASVVETLDTCSIRMTGTRLHWYRRMDWTRVFFYQGYEISEEKTKNESHTA